MLLSLVVANMRDLLATIEDAKARGYRASGTPLRDHYRCSTPVTPTKVSPKAAAPKAKAHAPFGRVPSRHFT